MSNTLIDLNLLPLETLAEMANESAEQAEKNAKLTVTKAIDSGRYLIAAKEQIEHGQWLTWLGQNWNYNQGQASRYMTISNYAHAHNLTEAKSIREALRMIGEEKTETELPNAPRSARKTGQVEVGEPDPIQRQIRQRTVKNPKAQGKSARTRSHRHRSLWRNCLKTMSPMWWRIFCPCILSRKFAGVGLGQMIFHRKTSQQQSS